MKIAAVIFSMDRALQLDSLLQSLQDHASGLDEIVVIYRASNQLHAEAYRKAALLHPTATFYAEKPLWGCAPWLGFVLADPTISHVCINVDDQVYFRPADFRAAARQLKSPVFVWSWRLGHHEAWTHVLQDRWATCNSKNKHYAYLWHSDGALYVRDTYTRVLDSVLPGWENRSDLIPNDLEQAAAASCPDWSKGLVHCGPIQQACMTWQINKESTTKGRYGAPWTTTPETELDALATAFLAGKRVDNQQLYKDLTWTTRFQTPTSAPTHVQACPEASQFYAALIR